MIDLYEYLARQIARINRKVALLCRDKKYRDKITLLCTAPGIGRLTAIEILVELQDMSRFKSAEELASYIGLTPSEYSTEEKTRQGQDHEVRQQAGTDISRGEHLGAHHERSCHPIEIPQAQKCKRREKGYHSNREKIPHNDQAYASRQYAVPTGGLNNKNLLDRENR